MTLSSDDLPKLTLEQAQELIERIWEMTSGDAHYYQLHLDAADVEIIAPRGAWLDPEQYLDISPPPAGDVIAVLVWRQPRRSTPPDST